MNVASQAQGAICFANRVYQSGTNYRYECIRAMDSMLRPHDAWVPGGQPAFMRVQIENNGPVLSNLRIAICWIKLATTFNGGQYR